MGCTCTFEAFLWFAVFGFREPQKFECAIKSRGSYLKIQCWHLIRRLRKIFRKSRYCQNIRIKNQKVTFFSLFVEISNRYRGRNSDDLFLSWDPNRILGLIWCSSRLHTYRVTSFDCLQDMDGILLLVTSAGKIVFISHSIDKILGHNQVSIQWSFYEYLYSWVKLPSTSWIPNLRGLGARGVPHFTWCLIFLSFFNKSIISTSCT
jgi:hypothetical protein